MTETIDFYAVQRVEIKIPHLSYQCVQCVQGARKTKMAKRNRMIKEFSMRPNTHLCDARVDFNVHL